MVNENEPQTVVFLDSTPLLLDLLRLWRTGGLALLPQYPGASTLPRDHLVRNSVGKEGVEDLTFQ